jgi:homocysteine S-methyltransferase
MARYRDDLPQRSGLTFLTDGGLETDLIFNRGIDLPLFAAVDALRSTAGRRAIERYYRRYLDIAEEHGYGFILETPTWRASPDWATRLGYGPGVMDRLNAEAVEMLVRLRDERDHAAPIVVSGQIGPRGDGYATGHRMSVDEAGEYHAQQIAWLAETDADQVTALTMNHPEEAAGVVAAAAAHGLPAVISFTVETDGRLPTGERLQEAIEQVDAVEPPAYYMINCAHATHYEPALESGQAWTRRIQGVRANASRLSHAELDESETLDDGDPLEFGADCARLQGMHRHINVVGGCCGTDHRHIEEVARRLA